MMVICLDSTHWQIPDDFYSALLPELGAPSWHGKNLDALDESLGADDINEVKPPFAVEINGTSQLSPPMREFLAEVVHVFNDAQERGRHIPITLR
jgi:RNAse (barnase) inhibitor barstar